jgi:hypothetical protein
MRADVSVVRVERDPKKPGKQVLRFLKPPGPTPKKVRALRWVLLASGLISALGVFSMMFAVLDVATKLDDVAIELQTGLFEDMSSSCEMDPSDGQIYCPTQDPEADGVEDPAAQCIPDGSGGLARDQKGNAYCSGVSPPADAPTNGALSDMATITQNVAALFGIAVLAAAIVIPVRMIVLFIRIPRGEPLVLTAIRRTALTQLILQVVIAATLAYIFSGVQEEELARFGSMGGNGLTMLSATIVLILAYRPVVSLYFTDHEWKPAVQATDPLKRTDAPAAAMSPVRRA